MPVIITLIIAIFLILISWTWNNLWNIDKTKRVITIVISLIVIAIITLIVFNISKSSVNYKSEEEVSAVRVVLVTLFTFVNGLVIMPSIAKTLSKIKNKEITKEQAGKRFLIAIAVFVIVLIIECGYLTSIQNGILDIYHSAKK